MKKQKKIANNDVPLSRSLSPIGHEEENLPQQFVFSHLPIEEKKRFMDFLVENQVEFSLDPQDNQYVATIKIVNQQVDQQPTVINGLDQMKALKSGQRTQQSPEIVVLQHQIQDLARQFTLLKSDNHVQEEVELETRKPVRKPITTPATQLQVYLKPEYQEFTKALQPKFPQQIRPKRMNIQQTLRMTEEIYSYRFSQRQKPNQQFQESIIEFLSVKYNKIKAKIDQAAVDLLASIEQHKENEPDVNLFYQFLTKSQPGFGNKEQMFFLYVRSLVEQLMSIIITKLPSNQDIRNVYLPRNKAFKLAQVYYTNAISAQSQIDVESAGQEIQQQSQQMADQLVETCIQHATPIGMASEGKINASYFLHCLLREFQKQEVVSLDKNPVHDYEDQPQQSEQDVGEMTIELLKKLVNFIVQVKIDALVKVMLEQLNKDKSLSKQQMSQISARVITSMEALIADMLQSAFTTQEVDWLNCLGIDHDDATDADLENFCQVTECMNEIFDGADQGTDLDQDLLENLAKIVLQVSQVRQTLAKVVSENLKQVKQKKK